MEQFFLAVSRILPVTLQIKVDVSKKVGSLLISIGGNSPGNGGR